MYKLVCDEINKKFIDYLEGKPQNVWLNSLNCMNWDYLEYTISWMVKQSCCDKLVAAAVFWLSCPEELFMVEYAEEARIERDYTVFILENWNKNFYSDGEFCCKMFFNYESEYAYTITNRINLLKKCIISSQGLLPALDVPDDLLECKFTGINPVIVSDIDNPKKNLDLCELFEKAGTKFFEKPTNRLGL